MLAPLRGSLSLSTLMPMKVMSGATAKRLADSPVPWLSGSVASLMACGARSTLVL